MKGKETYRKRKRRIKIDSQLLSLGEIQRARAATPTKTTTTVLFRHAGYEDALREHKTSYKGPIILYWESLHMLCHIHAIQYQPLPK